MGKFIRHRNIAEALLDRLRELLHLEQLDEATPNEEEKSSLEEGKGISVKDVEDIIKGEVESKHQPSNTGSIKSPRGNSGSYNLYPSSLRGDCCDLAVFISLTCPAYTRGQGHLDFGPAIEKIVQHCQGYCPEITKDAVFITDSWNPSIVYQWRANLENIQSKIHLEIYLLSVTHKNQSIHSLSF
jgi:hypothetical protein